jgi:hypothetical protein
MCDYASVPVGQTHVHSPTFQLPSPGHNDLFESYPGLERYDLHMKIGE